MLGLLGPESSENNPPASNSNSFAPAAKGFRGHWSGATGSDYRVIEQWDSREDFQAWYDGQIVPKLPPGVEVTPPAVFDLHFEIVPKG